jgi:hypothetical protein
MRRRSALFLLATLLAMLVVPGMAAAEPRDDDWFTPALRRVAATPVYRTQLDGSRYAGSNCGPAVLGMIFEAYGVTRSNLELREWTHTYQGTWPGRGGTALHHMARVAEDLGLGVYGLYEDPEKFHRWTIDEIAEQVAGGRWVIPLVRYGMLPGHETSGVRTGHYILLYAARGDGFVYHDPAFRPIEEGPNRWISRAQLDAAMNPVLVPRQAMAVGG